HQPLLVPLRRTWGLYGHSQQLPSDRESMDTRLQTHRTGRNSSFQTFSHFEASSSHLIGSTMLYLVSSVACVLLAGLRSRSLSIFWPSGDSRKSTNSIAAFGCGARLATDAACGRPTIGSTGIQSIGAPFFFSESALPL